MTTAPRSESQEMTMSETITWVPVAERLPDDVQC